MPQISRKKQPKIHKADLSQSGIRLLIFRSMIWTKIWICQYLTSICKLPMVDSLVKQTLLSVAYALNRHVQPHMRNGLNFILLEKRQVKSESAVFGDQALYSRCSSNLNLFPVILVWAMVDSNFKMPIKWEDLINRIAHLKLMFNKIN